MSGKNKIKVKVSKNKTKSRFDGLDVAAMTAHVKRYLLGHKLANVYDGIAMSTSIADSSSKGTFLFKLANPSGNNSSTGAAGSTSNSNNNNNNNSGAAGDQDATPSNRSMLLIESGVRFHTTSSSTSSNNSSNNSSPPSPFAMKLRKHLRNLRLENITQLGNLDRVVDFRFGSGDYSHHLILELYGLGNVILTNDKYVILALLRLHEYTNENGGGNVGNGGNDGNGNANGKANDNAEQSSEQVKVRVGNVYPVTYATTITSSSTTTTAEVSSTSVSTANAKDSILEMNGQEAYQWAKDQIRTYQDKIQLQIQQQEEDEINNKNKGTGGGGGGGGKTKKKKKKDANKDGSTNLKMLLLKPNSGVFHYGPSLIEHCILSCNNDTENEENNNDNRDQNQNIEPNAKFNLDTIDTIMPPSHWETLITSLKEEGSRILSNFNTGDNKGYILYREKEIIANESTSATNESKDSNEDGISTTLSEAIKKMPHSDKVFEEFQPHLLKQHQNRPNITYNNFSMAIDEFYSLMDGQKRALRAENAEKAARERLVKIKLDQSKRIQGLESEMMRLKDHAELVETHADDVDKAMSVINSALDSGMDWEALWELVQVEKANMNPIALLIKKLELEKDAIVLSLPDTMSWDQDEQTSPPIVDVTVSLKEGAYANARIMYDKYRSSKEKAIKTAEASEMALKAAEANAQRQIEQAQKNKNMTFSAIMQPQRKQHWFEKFHWFITSDNYIVIGGRDAQQNEILVKRYLRPGDAYLHADVHGAPTCILRAKRRRKSKGSTEVLPLSDQALKEAGNFAICKSSAWASRMVTSAWWVESHQVSKTAPTGEYLTVGSFMIRGRKNFLPPTSLEMGLAVLFRLGDDISVARHANDRRDFALMALEQKDEVNDEDTLDDNDIDAIPSKGKPSSMTTKRAQSSYDRNLGNDGDLSAFLKAGTSKSDNSNKVEFKKFMEEYEDDDGRVQRKESRNKIFTESSSFPVLVEKNIDDNGEFDAEQKDKVNDVESNEPTKKKGLSTKDRKLIKKYGSLEAGKEALSKLRKEEEERLAKKEALLEQKGHAQDQPQQRENDKMSRGKKNKMKKMAKKYADQDDEDRELAIMALQGSLKNNKKNRKKKGIKNNITADVSTSQAKVAAETAALLVRDAGEVVSKLPKDISDILAKCLGIADGEDDNARWNKLDAEVLEQLIALDSKDAQNAAVNRLLQLTESTRIDNYSASLAGIIRTVNKYGFEGIQPVQSDDIGGNEGKQRKTRAEKAAEKEAWREILAEDGIIEVGTDVDGPVDDTAEISKLTGRPLPEDVILYAIPVCAPYHILTQYKYKVKLTPGNAKRGKASKQCVEMFYRSEDQNNKNKNKSNASNSKSSIYANLIKGVNENEWVQAMCGDVKISAAGASKAIKKQKAGAKKKRK